MVAESAAEAARSAVARAVGPDVVLDAGSEPATLDVPSGAWVRALETLRDRGLDYFDWLSAAELPAGGFHVVAHLARVGEPGSVEHLLLRTTVPADAATLGTATGVFRGASWHERETHEMFGIDFAGHPHLVPLLLPDGFDGHPLKKDFVLVARAAKPWPGAKEPGESEGEASPSRRRMQPPGVPDASWGRPPGEVAAEPPPRERPPRRPRPAEIATAEAGPEPDLPHGPPRVAPR